MESATQKTAKIYSFPIRSRSASSAERLARLEREAHTYSKVEFGSGWYHEQAIDDASAKKFRRS